MPIARFPAGDQSAATVTDLRPFQFAPPEIEKAQQRRGTGKRS